MLLFLLLLWLWLWLWLWLLLLLLLLLSILPLPYRGLRFPHISSCQINHLRRNRLEESARMA
ncbi:hypothetical protein ABQE70_21075, partial [Xanthomonas campestris pv. campestris]